MTRATIAAGTARRTGIGQYRARWPESSTESDTRPLSGMRIVVRSYRRTVGRPTAGARGAEDARTRASRRPGHGRNRARRGPSRAFRTRRRPPRGWSAVHDDGPATSTRHPRPVPRRPRREEPEVLGTRVGERSGAVAAASVAGPLRAGTVVDARRVARPAVARPVVTRPVVARSVIAGPSSPGGTTPIGTSGEGSPPSGSVGEVAVATFTTSDPSPPYPGSSWARIRNATDAPGSSDRPEEQVTTRPAAVHPSGEPTNRIARGSSSTAPTSAAVPGPRLRAVTRYSTSSPGATPVEGDTDLSVSTWASGPAPARRSRRRARRCRPRRCRRVTVRG